MEAFDVLGDPVRRRIVELVSHGEVAAGDLATTITAEFGISQPAVSQHLRVLRESGFATVRPVGTRRLYALEPAALGPVESWLADVRQFWTPRLDALETEIARGSRRRGARNRPNETTRKPT